MPLNCQSSVIGLQFDTDANQAVETSVPGQIGQTVTRSTLQKQGDWSFVTKARVKNTYATSAWRGIVWETNAGLSDQRFFRLSHDYDLTTLQVDTGPRMTVAQIGGASVSVRPFGSFAWIGYGENTYSTLYGGGVSAEARGAGWATRLLGQGRFGAYEDSSFRPMSRPYTGPEWILNLSATVLAGWAGTITSSFSWYEASGRSDDFSRRGPAGSVSLERNISLPDRVAVVVGSGSIQRLAYGGPVPQTQTITARDDTQLIADILFNIPVFRSPAIVGLHSAKVLFEYQYLNNESNYFPFENHSFLVSIKLAPVGYVGPRYCGHIPYDGSTLQFAAAPIPG